MLPTVGATISKEGNEGNCVDPLYGNQKFIVREMKGHSHFKFAIEYEKKIIARYGRVALGLVFQNLFGDDAAHMLDRAQLFLHYTRISAD